MSTETDDKTEYKGRIIEKVNHPQLGIIYIIQGSTMIHPSIEQAKKSIDWNEKYNSMLLFGNLK